MADSRELIAYEIIVTRQSRPQPRGEGGERLAGVDGYAGQLVRPACTLQRARRGRLEQGTDVTALRQRCQESLRSALMSGLT